MAACGNPALELGSRPTILLIRAKRRAKDGVR